MRGQSLKVTRRVAILATLAATVMRVPSGWAHAGRPIRRAYARQDAGQLHYRIATPVTTAASPPLICLHDYRRSGRAYEQFMRAMATDRTVVAPDIPGYGDSDPHQSPPGIPDYAKVMVEFIRQLRFSTVDLIAHRGGSAIAVELARAFPERVRRLVLLSVPAFTEAERLDELAKLHRPELSEDGTHLTELWADHVAYSMRDWTTEEQAYHFTDVIRRIPISWWGPDAALNYDLRTNLSRLQQPVLILVPDDDLRQPSRRAGGLPDRGRTVELPEWGKGLLDVRADELASLLQEFLSG